VVLSSGYGLNVQAQKLIEEGVRGFIQKPYLMVQLSQVVSKALSKDRIKETSDTREH
jgi:FixJ family two-component response regulator